MTYGYDAASRLTSVTNGSYSATYSYIANSPLVGQIVFRDSTTTRMTTSKTYDSLNRLLSISSATTAPVSSYAYQYNDANQRTRIDMVDGSSWLYEYDKLGQVISGKRYWADGTPVPGQQYEYGFDDIGNRSSTKSGGDAAGQNLRSATYGANTLNQYTNRTIPAYIQSMGAANPLATVTVNGQSTARRGEYFEAELSVNNASAEVFTSVTNLATYGTSGTNIGSLFTPKTPEVFSYDADGNLTNDGRWVYTWDGENRLTKMESQTSAPAASKRKVVYGYDYQSRMIARTCYTNLGGSYGVSTDAKFVFDGWRQVAELNATNNNVVRGFTWGLDLSGSMEGAGGVGGLLMFTDAATSTTHFTGYDGNGNVTTLVKASDASKSADYEHSPFGEVIRSSGSIASANPFRFSTKYQDEATELSYYGYRFYNSSVGRWPSRDPLGENGGVNLYRFARNSPTGTFDTDGRMEVSECQAAVKTALARNATAKKILASLKKRGCPDPQPTCVCCSNGGSVGGSFKPNTKKIELCADVWSSGTTVISAVVHELVHALDDCKGSKWSECKERACSEIRAYDRGGTCAPGAYDRQGPETYRQCIRRKAISSVLADPKCTAADVDDQMDDCLGSEL